MWQAFIQRHADVERFVQSIASSSLSVQDLMISVDTVDAKYTRFSNIASENAIRDNDIFNGHQLVDCELLALAFNTYKKRNGVKTCE